MVKIRPYKMHSNSARLLAEAMSVLLGKKVFRTDNPRAMQRHTIINWGSSDFVYGERIINCPPDVKRATNKLDAFNELQHIVAIPWHTSSKSEAQTWAREGHTVYCRTLVNSHEGRGIVLAKTPEEVVDAPLYTKRFKNSKEYRVHVAFGKAIQVVQKKKRNGTNADPNIRSNDNWVFARNISGVPDEVVRQAILAVTTLGLDFGAVDVVWSVKNQKACVLEVNTAPGLDQTSANIYAKAFVDQYRLETR